MINKLTNLSGLLGVAALVACGGSGNFTTKSGTEVSYLKTGKGEHPIDGQILTMHISYLDEKANSLFNSVEKGGGRAMPMLYNDSAWQNQGVLYEVIRELKTGDSVQFKIKAEDLFEGTFGVGLPDSIRRGSMITFNCGIDSVMSEDAYRQLEIENQQKEMKKMMEASEEQLAVDLELIDNYLKKNNITAKTTDSGLRYVITKEGSGEKATAGNMVSVHYLGTTLAGVKFDASYDRGEPIEFLLGRGQVISGWDEGIALLNPGAKATLYIPSSLAYGPRARSADIGPNEILIFDVELVSLKQM